MTDPAPELATDAAPIPFVEFVALVACLMAMVALGIDSMLPALPAIGRSLHVAEENRRQLVITAFTFGFGVAQLVHGPVTDRYGRRRVLLVSLAAYAAANIACAAAASFALLMTARVLGGVAVAATRVTTQAMVRDCFAGRAMARVMSTAFMVFMLVPVIAPTFGAGVLLVGSWRLIFWVIAGLALLLSGWIGWRVPDTLHPQDRAPIAPARIVAGWRQVAGDRWSVGYTLASTALLGALYGYLTSIQQVVAETFGRPGLLQVVFAVSAGAMALANLLNTRIVMRLGTRVISHGALVMLIAASALNLSLSAAGWETVWTFTALQAVTLGAFGLATANFSAMAMANMGHIAGVASSVQGFTSVTVGTILGAVIGQGFDGSERPMTAGFLLAGLVALFSVAVAERGRLFRPALS